MNEEKLTYLLDQYLDGEITDEEAKGLLATFDSDPEAKSWFIDEVAMSNLIYGLETDDEFQTDVLESIRNESDEAVGVDLKIVEREFTGSDTDVEEQPLFKIQRRMVGMGLAACAAVLLLGYGYKFLNPSPVAVLVHSDEAVWQGDEQPKEGDSLFPGTFHLTSGVATFKHSDAVRVTLEGPTKYELIKTDVTRLHQGILNAHVLPEGIGFKVYTERAKVVDLGTTFSIAVDEKQETAVTVFEGKVDVENSVNHKCEIIEEGAKVKLSRTTDGIAHGVLHRHAASQGLKQLFGVSRTSGNVRFMDAQTMGNLADFRDSDNILVIPEQVGKLIDYPLAVTIIEPGSYGLSELKDREEVLDLKETRADVYLIQYNPVRDQYSAEGAPLHFSGRVEFNRRILGVISRTSQLKATDKTLGKSRFDYEGGATSRGIEHDDRIELSSDRKSLELDWEVARKWHNRIDQIRVLVESD